MLNFLRLSKKKKVNVQDVMDLYFEHLNDVIQDGFVEIKDFINNNNNLESSPNISDSEIDTFRLFILLYNIYNLESYFEEYQISILRTKIIDKTLIYIDNNEELAMEKFLNYEKYFKELVDEAIQDGRISSGELIASSGFGAGVSWGAALLRWNGPIGNKNS